MRRLGEIMTPQAECLRPDASLQEAAQQMRAYNVSFMPVCEDDQLVGILTARDITMQAPSQERDMITTRVREICTPHVVPCLEDQDIVEAAKLMQANHIHRLVVCNQAGELVGIADLRTMLDAIISMSRLPGKPTTPSPIVDRIRIIRHPKPQKK
jgi:CBS domain-containing protein